MNYNLTYAQAPAGSETPFYLYKTEDDFFNGKKSYRGEWLQKEGNKITYTLLGTKTKLKLNLGDSASSYYAHCEAGNIWIRLTPESKDYHLYGGGTKDAFCIMGGTGAVYDNDGYIKELFWQDWFEIYYYSKSNNINGSKNIEDLLKVKPKLLEKYLAEKSESDKKAWKRNKIPTEMKYLKMFNAEK